MRAPRAGDGARQRGLRTLAATIGLASLTALVFAAALVATMPASVLPSLVTLPPQVETLAGTVRRGRATLAGGHALDWTFRPGDLLRGRIGADAVVEGSDTLLRGRLAASPWGVSATGWAGRAGPGLLALAPRVALRGCTPRAAVAVDRLSWGRRAAAEGAVTIPEGTCALRGGTVAVPAMTLTLTTEAGAAVARLSRDADGAALASAIVTPERAQVRVEPAGAALVPGMPSSAATEIEYAF